MIVIRYLLPILIVSGMVGLAAFSGEREVIFPELAAIALGLFVVPKGAWKTSLPRLSLCTALCALIGTGLVYLPGPLTLRLILAFALAQGVLMLSGTSFAPMVSAAVLPVLIGSRGWVYPVSAIVLTGLCAGVRWAGERAGFFESRPKDGGDLRTPLHYWGGWGEAGVRLGLVAVLIGAALAAGLPLIVAPPLLVAYLQLTRADNPAAAKPARAVLLVILAAAVGVAARASGIPALGAALTMAGVLALCRVLKLTLPPAAAVAIIPFLLPEVSWWLYVLQIALGILALVVFSRLRYKKIVTKIL